MSLDQLAAISQVAGTIAVIGSLIFVGFQIRQQNDQLKLNRKALRADFEANSVSVNHNFALALAQDAELFDVVRRTQMTPETVSPIERGRFGSYMWAMMVQVQVGYLVYLDGSSSDDILQGHAGFTAPLLRTPGGLAWWKRNRQVFLPSVRAYADGLAGLGPLLPPGLPEGHPLLAPPATAEVAKPS